MPYRSDRSLIGTARYASLNAHLGIEQSRRDDMESIGNMLLYFLRGCLPWQGIEAKDKFEKYRLIKKKKLETSIESLCKDYPKELTDYFNYCRNLEFEETPNYNYLRKLFKDLYIAKEFKEDMMFEWSPDNKVAPSISFNRLILHRKK
eukprot:TRINITY_DN1862_c0_g1_i1.p7 TRINITY_DN1862_c0_g1~~TRINITY_DN1862_c0_g1_i1.p7  ORF type:complete len:148 (+),score=19.62 TRINITY_DN1862_c0_g1_i1:718-1161(+)